VCIYSYWSSLLGSVRGGLQVACHFFSGGFFEDLGPRAGSMWREVLTALPGCTSATLRAMVDCEILIARTDDFLFACLFLSEDAIKLVSSAF
jgi:hypothetical protein